MVFHLYPAHVVHPSFLHANHCFVRVWLKPAGLVAKVQPMFVAQREVDVQQGADKRLRMILHDLSNLLTGILVSGGLLRQALRGDGREHYATEVCEGGERAAELIREAREIS